MKKNTQISRLWIKVLTLIWLRAMSSGVAKNKGVWVLKEKVMTRETHRNNSLFGLFWLFSVTRETHRNNSLFGLFLLFSVILLIFGQLLL